MSALLRKLFSRRQPPPLMCAINLDLDHDDTHEHTAACFLAVEPLAAVELFQSQGCAACPPAVPGILEAANKDPNVVLLSYNVTLFDHLGWKDTLASPAWDGRLKTYARRWGRPQIYTPMLVANGVADGNGAAGGDGELAGVVKRARMVGMTQIMPDWHIFVDANDTDVRIDSDKPLPPPIPYEQAAPDAAATMMQPAAAGPAEPPYDVVVVVYESTPSGKPDPVVKVGKGANKGKKLASRNNVKDVVKIGEWMGGTIVLPLPMARSAMQPGLDAVVMVQAPGGGPIVGVAKI